MESVRPRWDIFCKVVDNFGDIGVCWRLARQLAAEHNLEVRLWTDDLVTFHRINTAIDPALASQASHGVQVWRWSHPFPLVVPADVVVETFGCEVPESYQQAMATRSIKPAWINLEYLSAESWVNDCHALPSPHPRLPLTKYFFFPGFAAGAGGLLRERDLIARRDAFLRDPTAKNTFWQSLGLPSSSLNEIRISLFCYENLAIPDLLATWANGGEPIRCLVPEGMAAEQVKAFFTATPSSSLDHYAQGNLRAHVLPFVEQPEYDQLLWACDCNFVRGEDSFVRAQWAAHPFVWHIYPQEENAHWIKLNAFIDHYCAEMTPDMAADMRAFWRAWNSGRGIGQAWTNFCRHRAALQTYTRVWAEHLIGHGDLAANLVRFVSSL